MFKNAIEQLLYNRATNQTPTQANPTSKQFGFMRDGFRAKGMPFRNNSGAVGLPASNRAIPMNPGGFMGQNAAPTTNYGGFISNAVNSMKQPTANGAGLPTGNRSIPVNPGGFMGTVATGMNKAKTGF